MAYDNLIQTLGNKYNDRIMAALAAVDARLSKRGYKVQVGSDMEFRPLKPHEANYHEPNEGIIEKWRNELVEHAKASGNLQDVAMIQTYTPQEILVTYLYELSDIAPLLKYRKGIKDDGTGIYDNPGIFELRLLHSDVTEFDSRAKKLFAEFWKLAEQANIAMNYGGRHLHLSIKNPMHGLITRLSLEDNAERLAISKGALQGMLQAVHDGSLFLGPFTIRYDSMLSHTPDNPLPKYYKNISASPSRSTNVRLARDTYEYRERPQSFFSEAPEIKALTLLILLLGFEYGLIKVVHDDSIGVGPMLKDARRGFFIAQGEIEHNDLLVTILEDGTIGENGMLVIPEGYVNTYLATMMHAFHMPNPSLSENPTKSAQKIAMENRRIIKEFFANIRIEDNGHIIWPDIAPLVAHGADRAAVVQVLNSIECERICPAFVVEGYGVPRKESPQAMLDYLVQNAKSGHAFKSAPERELLDEIAADIAQDFQQDVDTQNTQIGHQARHLNRMVKRARKNRH